MNDRIVAAHGSGGKLMNDLITNRIARILGKENIQQDDSAIIEISSKKIAFTSDTFTVSPLFFPGGDIGKIAVNGTVNDLAVMGASPAYLSCGLILEEGLECAVLDTILHSMKEAADYAQITFVTGDTKVVPRGDADKMFINTSGIGLMETKPVRSPLEVGDKIIVSGHIGDHGITIMAKRNKLSFSKGLQSDCAPLNHLVKKMTRAFPGSINFMRDPTRGGLASVLNEMVSEQKIGAEIFEAQLPIRDEVRGVCEILGLDPLYAANEGKLCAIVRAQDAEEIVKTMKTVQEGFDAQIVGEITDEFPGKTIIRTAIGGKRILPLLTDEQLPRIC